MVSDLFSDFFSIYGEIRGKFDEFIRNSPKPKMKLFDLQLNVKNQEEYEIYCDLFSSYSSDLLVANKFFGSTVFSIEDFLDCDANFVMRFTEFSEKLISAFNGYTFELSEDLSQKSRITTDIFHFLGEKLVGKEDQDSGAVFTPIGIVKFLSLQSLIVYLQKNTAIDNSIVTELILNPTTSLLARLTVDQLDYLHNLLTNIRILDPACGSGLFCLTTARILASVHSIFPAPYKKMSLSDLLQANIFGIDINPKIIFKLYFLMRIWTKKETNRAIDNDILKTNFVCDDSLLRDFHENKKYDIILGNPPYVRQENIRELGITKIRETLQSNHISYKQRIRENIGRKNHKINKRSDLYIYFFYLGLQLLKSKGIISYLTSNSWLNIGFGFEFQEFLLKNLTICSIIDFDSRAFSSAEINTIITTLCKDKRENNQDFYCKFVKIKQPLKLGSVSVVLKDLREKINGIGDVKTNLESSFSLIRFFPLSTIEARTRWGNELLLAPNLYFLLKERLGTKILKLKDVAVITRGITTGLNKFFILKHISGDGEILTVKNGYDYKFQIESSYLKPYLISPKQMKYPKLRKNEINHYILDIPYDFEENGPSLAAKYIQYGRKMKIKLTKGSRKGSFIHGAHNIPTLMAKKRYYEAGLPQGSFGTNIFIQKIFSSKFKIYFTSLRSEIWANNTFYNINLKPHFKRYSDLVISSLLSSITYLSIELNGRRSFGMGALDTATFDIGNIMVVNPQTLNQYQRKNIQSCMKSISSRKFMEVTEEFLMEDRRKLDEILLEHLDLSSKQQELYEEIKELVNQRISKSKTYKRK